MGGPDLTSVASSGPVASSEPPPIAGIGWDEIAGVLRAGLTAGGGVFVTEGIVNASQLQDAIGAAIVIAGTVWSVLSKRLAKQAIVTAAATGVAPASASGVKP